MAKILAILLIVFSSLFSSVIKVSLATNVTYAIDELKKEFNKLHPDIKLLTTISSSGKLTAQIRHGADFDLFLSANMKYPKALYKDGIAKTKPVVYAQGSLILLSSQKRDFSKGIDIITDEGIKKIAVANPKLAPYGKATIEAIKSLKLYDKVKDKFIFGESIGQTVIYTLNAADIGFIAKSTIFSPKLKGLKEGENWIDVDPKTYNPIFQGMVLLKDNKDAKAFYDFMLSDSAKKILKKYGYIVP